MYIRFFFFFYLLISSYNIIMILESCTWFERISMMAILLNCVTLGMYQPCEDNLECKTPRCRVLQTSDDIIFAFFAIEMMIKMMAMGITGAETAYMSDTWNRLDFFIVAAGCVSFYLSSSVSIHYFFFPLFSLLLVYFLSSFFQPWRSFSSILLHFLSIILLFVTLSFKLTFWTHLLCRHFFKCSIELFHWPSLCELEEYSS